MFDTAVLFLIFNRPSETEKVFDQILKIKPRYLFIAADGPRKDKPGEIEICSEVRRIIIDNVDWDCELKTLFREDNLGCGRSVSEAITWFFNHVDQGIILEDDCLPDQSFFYYCQELLEKYKNDSQIISIGGTNLGYSFNNNQSYSFSNFMNMWGWATWKRSAILVDYNLDKWKRMPFKKLFLMSRLGIGNSFDLNWINYWKNYFNLTASGEINTWDYQWVFTQLLYRKKSIFPSKNLIKNIGFTQNATHTVFPDHPVASLNIQSLKTPLIHPDNKEVDKVYENGFIKKVWVGINSDSLFKITKTKLLYIPFVNKINNWVKKFNA